MKKTIFITLAMLAMLTFSCTEDLKNSNTPTSSVWRSSNFTDTTLSSTFDYYEIRFISNSTFELWVKSKTNESPERVNQTYSYSINGKTISINYNEITSNGSIDKSTMSITEDGNSLTFVKI